jgi:hypothetical protein
MPTKAVNTMAVYDQFGVLCSIVVPTYEEELDDPAHMVIGGANAVSVKMTISEYNSMERQGRPSQAVLDAFHARASAAGVPDPRLPIPVASLTRRVKEQTAIKTQYEADLAALPGNAPQAETDRLNSALNNTQSNIDSLNAELARATSPFEG